MTRCKTPVQILRSLVATAVAITFVCLLAFSSFVGAQQVPKSPNDDREYRALKLDNGLKVLLISDADTAMAAAAVDVNAGSNSDPEGFAGLAHFLEHMLFLGTEGFPNAGEYQEYISAHGGSNNAYTSYENTNYYFDIDSAYIGPALERFSQFFKSPLFTPEYVDRERNAVHSEYQSGLQDDSRRAYSIFKELINPLHPLAGFSVGSLETLQDQDSMSLRAALLQQYERYYSANLMSLVIFGKEPLDELQALAEQYFSSIRDRQRTSPLSDEALFSPASLPALLEIKPIRDSRSLSYTFPIDVVQDRYKSKPLQYLGNVLGHEGEGSLLALLRQRGWANSLSAGGGFSYADAASFTINIGLTEAGLDRVDEITALLFQFINLIREDGIHEWLFAEQRVMADLSFRFQEPANPISAVSNLSRRLQEYPFEEVNTAPYAYTNYDADLIKQILADLVPEHLLLSFTSRAVDTDKLDPWYEAPYRISELTPERIESWRNFPIAEALSIAEPNTFLPENIELKEFVDIPQPENISSAEAKPRVLIDEGGTRMWFKQDAEFSTPRANFFLYALSPLFQDSLRDSLLSNFVVRLVNDQLNEFSYPANLAGSFFGLTSRARGFTLTVSGYSDKQEELLETLLQTLIAADFEQERFDIIRSELVRSWNNAQYQTPYVRLFEMTQALLLDPYWSEEEKIAEVSSITLEEIQAFVPELLSSLRLDLLYHGNVVPADAHAMFDVVTKYLAASEDAQVPPYGTVVKMPTSSRVLQELEIDHDDSAIVLYMQGDDDSLHTQAILELLGTIIGTPFYEELRTDKQLGYIVNAGALLLHKVSALLMYIESPNADPLVLEASIDEFLAGYSEVLAAMEPLFFEGVKSGLLNSLREPEQRLGALSSRYWNDILIGEFEKDSTLSLADAIESLSLEDVVAFYQERVINAGQARLVARSAGREVRESFSNMRNEPDDAVILDQGFADYRAFKRNAERYEFR